MAPHEVEEKKLEEKMRKRRGFAWRNVLMSFALTLLFLLCSVVSTVPARSEASGVQCSEFLQEAVRLRLVRVARGEGGEESRSAELELRAQQRKSVLAVLLRFRLQEDFNTH
ncbi:hypothetical protein MHYP_G00189560 [Metynnis hypsauchen]